MMNDYSKYSDEKLLALLREQSPICDRAFDAIFSRYSANLNSFCIFKADTREDAEEIFEDTWLKFIEKVRDGRELTKILPYLYTIARNLAIDRYRQKKAEKTIQIDYRDINDIDELANPFHLQGQMDSEELMTLVKVAADNLEEVYKEAFILYWFGGMTHKEISEIQGTTAANTKMRCHRAMNEIIKILRPYYIE